MPAGARLALNAAAPPLRSVSTDGVNVSERHEFWEAGAGFLFGALQLQQLSRDPFDASFSYTHIGDLVFCRLIARVPHRVERTEAVARHDDRPFLKAVLQTKGHSVIGQGGRTTPLYAGQWTVYDAGQPYSVAASSRAEFSMLLIPRARVAARDLDLRGIVLRPFPAHRGFGKLIWSLIDNTIDQIPELGNHSSFDVADIVAQMARLALLDSLHGQVNSKSRDALRERVKLYISAHLGDPDLSIAKLAGLTHCSKRYLHMIFRTGDVSISGYILKARLERCRAELLNPACAHRSITDIAYSWGFSNSNHFSRCFKREFGVSPRDLRLRTSLWPIHSLSTFSKPS
jgi:AraC-like DNA-binding protein